MKYEIWNMLAKIEIKIEHDIEEAISVCSHDDVAGADQVGHRDGVNANDAMLLLYEVDQVVDPERVCEVGLSICQQR